MKLRGLLITVFTLAWIIEAIAGCPNERNNHLRFKVSQGEVHDNKTNLIWERCSVGLSLKGDKCMGSRQSLSLDEALAVAAQKGEGWHVPSVNELSTIVDPSCGRPAIDISVFPDMDAAEGENPYWTNSQVGLADLFYYVDFGNGEVDGHTRGFSLGVRLVRGGGV